MTANLDLFPETLGGFPPKVIEWRGSQLDKWDQARVSARVIAIWSGSEGWRCGWYANADQALDEWHPHAPKAYLLHRNYPWYRLGEMPVSRDIGVACGVAARALKIVLEQMLSHVDPILAGDVRILQELIEHQARRWLAGEGPI